VATTEWESLTLGQNKTIQKIAEAAGKASELLDANVKLASGTLKAAGVFLTGLLGPHILLLRTTADTIDDFVKDFKNIGFFVLEVTPDGKYLIPQGADKNPIKLLLHSVKVTTNASLAAAAGQSIEFAAWAKEFLGEEDIYLTGAQKSQYPVEVGKSQPQASLTDNASDNKLATLDGLTGLYKMTPSQVIATIIAAMDDELDLRRPQFSKSAKAGALVLIVGVSDLTKNLANIKSIVDAFLTFFGGAEKTDKRGKKVKEGGIATGVAKLGTLIEAALGQANTPSKNDTTLFVNSIAGVRGTEDDKYELSKSGTKGIPYLFGYPAEGFPNTGGNTPHEFELNDFVVGPRVKFGQRCMGYVSKIIDTGIDSTAGYLDGMVYYEQELVIRGVTELDAIGFRNLSTGAKLQKASLTNGISTFIDQNSGLPVREGPFNDYEYIANLPNIDTDFRFSDPLADGTVLTLPHAKKAWTKVVHDPDADNPWLLKVLEEEDITEEHTIHFDVFSHKHITQNTVIGNIVSPKTLDAPHPNFKASKLEDLIGDFNVFFASIDALTDTLRKMADDSAKALQDIIDYLDSKIKELEEINAALQKILKLFTIGLPAAGIYTLNIPVAEGGNDYIKEELQGAANRPPDDLDFTFGFMLMGGGTDASANAFKTMQELLAAS
jgi:hypothetical protein